MKRPEILKKTLLRSSLLGVGALGLVALSSAPAMSANPYKLKYTDNDYITVTGDVKAVHDEAFTLDFDEGMITVEMDDWDWYDEANLLKAGEKVTVYGRIDNGWFESKTIEAGSIYAHDRATYYYANDADEEADYTYYSYYVTYPAVVPDGTWMSASGEVTDISGRELTLDTGAYKISVDTIGMAYNPLDDKGYQQIDEGDRIYVSGKVDVGIFDENELAASTITVLVEDKTKKVKKDK